MGERERMCARENVYDSDLNTEQTLREVRVFVCGGACVTIDSVMAVET